MHVALAHHDDRIAARGLQDHFVALGPARLRHVHRLAAARQPVVGETQAVLGLFDFLRAGLRFLHADEIDGTANGGQQLFEKWRCSYIKSNSSFSIAIYNYRRNYGNGLFAG